MYRSVLAEGWKKPAVMLCNEGFSIEAKSVASKIGMPGLRIVSNSISAECKIIHQVEIGINAVMEEIVAALTKPLTSEEKAPKKGVEVTSGVVFKGNLDEVNQFFYMRGWTDGLPIIPPTPEKINEMLSGTDLPVDHVVSKIPTRLGNATVEKIAVNAVMAGALPNYMPLLIAAVQSVSDPKAFLDRHAISTFGWAPVWIINGPVRCDLNIRSGAGVLSPGDIANATIGRAMGLILKNIGGVRKGIEDMGTFGNPMKYSTVIGENEEESPWDPLHVEQGFKKEESTVTLFFPNSFQHCRAGDDAKSTLDDMVKRIPATTGQNLFLLTPTTAKLIVDSGLSKKEIYNYIYEYARVPVNGYQGLKPGIQSSNAVETIHAMINSNCIRAIVAGGPHSGVCKFEGSYKYEGHEWVTKKIDLPANWSQLVAKYQNLVPTYTIY